MCKVYALSTDLAFFFRLVSKLCCQSNIKCNVHFNISRKIGEEESKKTALLLKLNMADYKSQLEQAVKSSSTTHSITFIDNNLAIKKQTSSGVLFNIAVIPLKELEFTTTLPEFMAEIDKSMTQMSDELVAKDNVIDKLNKGNH